MVREPKCMQIKASIFQKRFWLEWLLDKSSARYNTPLIFEVEGNISDSALKQSLTYFVNNHDYGCRSIFQEREGELYQVVLSNVDVEIEHLVATEETIHTILLASVNYEFDLTRGPLFKFTKIENSDDRVILVLNFHHIITDARSAKYFVQALQSLYGYYSSGADIELISDASSEADVGLVDAFTLDDTHTDYWVAQLQDYPLSIALPRQEIPQGKTGAHSYYFEIPRFLMQEIRRFCRRNRCTPFILFSSLYGYLLSLFSDQSRVVVNYPVDSRQKKHKRKIGCYVNNFLLAIDFDECEKISDVIEVIKRNRDHAKRYSKTTLTNIIKLIRESDAESGGNVFNVGIVEAYFDESEIALGDGVLKPLKQRSREVINDLMFAYQQDTDAIRCRFDYDMSCFDEGFMRYFSEAFVSLIENVVRQSETSLVALKQLLMSTKQKLGFKKESEFSQSVLKMFEYQVLTTPSAPAVYCSQACLTYSELDKNANALATKIRSHKTSKPIVAVLLNRDLFLPTALLAIWKVGKAYIPLLPDNPIASLSQAIFESKVDLVVSSKVHASLISALNIEAIFVDGDESGEFFDEENVANTVPEDLAYLLYTSGSTGKPKGVMIEHGNLSSVLNCFKSKLSVRPEDRAICSTTYIFDIFGLELFLPLVSGASVYLLNESQLDDLGELKQSLDVIQPTLMQGTPSFWQMLQTVGWVGEKSSLTVLCGGEALSSSVANYLLQVASRVIQVYGPTETTIWSTSYDLHDANECHVIGTPLSSTKIIINDTQACAVLPYVKGELYIGGEGVSPGYYENESLTALSFVNIHDAGHPAQRYYRTGDIAYQQADGNLVFVGRNDQQVKIRGHRIELLGIEVCLNRMVGVKQGIVKAQIVNGELAIVAFYISESSNLNDPEVVANRLREILPEYMVPRFIERVDHFKLTANGKVDRKKMIVAQCDQGRQAREDESDLSYLEKGLLRIWRDTLGLVVSSVDDNFFELGGHSIKVAKMIVELENQFGVRMSMSDIRSRPTIHLLSEVVTKRLQIKNMNNDFVCSRLSKGPLSSQQHQLWLAVQKNPVAAFNVPICQKLTGAIDVNRLEKSLNQLLSQHSIFRCEFVLSGATNTVHVRDDFNPLILLPERVSNEKLVEVLMRESNKPFNLAKPPYYRVRLLTTGEDAFYLLLVFHHMIVDGWSLDILSRHLSKLYNLPDAGISISSNSYLDYAVYQTSYYQSDLCHQVGKFWCDYLSGSQPLRIHTYAPKVTSPSLVADQVDFQIAPNMYAAMKAKASCARCSMFSLLVMGLATIFCRYGETSDFLIWTPVANRLNSQFSDVVGLFTELLPLRVKVNEHDLFEELLASIEASVTRVLDHQEVSPVFLSDILAKEMSLFDNIKVVFSFQSANEQIHLNLNDVVTEYMPIQSTHTPYEIHINIHKDGDSLKGSIRYQRYLYSRDYIVQLSKHFISVLDVMVDGNAVINDMSFAGEDEQWLHPSLSASVLPNFDAGLSIIEVFKCHASHQACNLAVVDGEDTISYQELDLRSSRLALQIKGEYEKQISCDDLSSPFVGIFMNRSIELIVTILAVLKAGYAYVPIDPNTPAVRVNFILQDSGANLLLSQTELKDKFELSLERTCSLLLVDGIRTDEDINPLESRVTPESLAYVIYTSGSTGQPKGSLITHANVVRLFDAANKRFLFDSNDVWCLFHSYAFDFSIWEIFGALLSGAKLVITPFDVSRDPHRFRKMLFDMGVTVLSQTPTAFGSLVRIESNYQNYLPLRYVVFGGEKLEVSILKSWWDKYTARPVIVNMYGITETTVHVTYKEITPQDLDYPSKNNIGVVLDDLRAYVFNNKHACETNVPGELYIAGKGLSKGYLNREKLTKQTFISGSEFALSEPRLYKTGDKVMWLPSGELCYLGRIDNQVKVRGFRVQLDELASLVMNFPSVSDVRVLYHPEHKAIAVYMVTTDELYEQALLNELSNSLPEYMLPRYYATLMQMPLTSNGKVDDATLLTLQLSNFLSQAYEPALNSREKVLMEVIEETLNLTKVSRNDNYLYLGGDSIRVLDMVGRLASRGYDLEISDVFKHPVISHMAAYLSQKLDDKRMASYENFSLLDDGLRENFSSRFVDVYPLTRLQMGMIYHSEHSDVSSKYIDVLSCMVNGSLNFEGMKLILSRLQEIHSVLRTVLIRFEDQLLQGVLHCCDLDVELIDLTGAGASDLDCMLAKQLDYERGKKFALYEKPLWRIRVYQFEQTHFNLSLICHHAILDGWSVATFFKELLGNYDRLLKGKELNFVRPQLDFSCYVAREAELIASHANDYWRQHLSSFKPCFVSKEKVNDVVSNDLKTRKIELNSQQTSQLKMRSEKFGLIVDSLLLSVHIYSLSLSLGQRKLVTGLTANTRLSQVSSKDVLGLFLNPLPLAVEVSRGLSFEKIARAIAALRAELQPYQAYPYAEILKQTKRQQWFDVLFNYIDFHVFEQLVDLAHIGVEPSYSYDETNFALLTQCQIAPVTRECSINFIYHTQQVSEKFIVLYQSIFQYVLDGLLGSADSVIRIEAQNDIFGTYFPLEHWNDTSTPLQASSLYSLFLDQVRRKPTKKALIENDVTYTYGELLAKVIDVREHLRKQLRDDVLFVEDTLVSICIGRSVESVVAMLAVISLGIGYVPIDPTHPKARIQYYLDNSKALLVVTTQAVVNTQLWMKNEYGDKLVVINEPMFQCERICEQDNDHLANDRHLAYVMYTSGSTGCPKGVSIEQQGIVRLVTNSNFLQIESTDVVAHTSNVSFDVSTFEIWGALLNGATLVVFPQEKLLDSVELHNELVIHNVNIMWLTARLFDQLLVCGSPDQFSKLDFLMLGGDVLNKDCVAKLFDDDSYLPRRLLNGYGPTENTSFSTTYDITRAALSNDSIPIGKPISNTRAYILDENMNVLPVGFIGELYLAGVGLARDYFDADELTAVRFVEADLYMPISGKIISERLYRTGDLATWLADGNLEFHGRVDRTIKVSGYQVNLDDVESRISSLSSIKLARVVSTKEGVKKIVCYYVGEENLDISVVKLSLIEMMPIYMIPSIYIALDEFPLTKNGKIDDAALPLVAGDVEPSQDYIRLDPMAEKIKSIWTKVLGHSDFTADDKFFDIGGNSLLAMQLHWELKSQVKKCISVVDIFRYPTIESFSKYIDEKSIATVLSEKRDVTEKMKLARRRLKTISTVKE